MKLAIITGGSKGLGEATVNQLVDKNWRVYELSRSGKTRNNVRCDLSKIDSVMDTNMQAQIRDADSEHFPEKQKFLDLNSNGLLRSPEKVAGHLTGLIENDLISGQTYSILE